MSIIDQMNVQSVLKWEDYNVNDQLVNSEILSDDEIQECLYRASNEEWIQIYKNRFGFPINVRHIIESIELFRERKPVGKLRLRAMNDDEWVKRNNAEELVEQRKQAEAFTEAWGIEQERVRAELRVGIEKDIQIYIGIVKSSKDKLKQYIANKGRTYVPPSRKKTLDPTQLRLENEVASAENELENLQQKVVSTSFYSLAARKHAFQKEWLSLMQTKTPGSIEV